MNTETLESRVRRTVAANIKLPLDRVGPDAGMDSLPEWDSMAHLMLVLSLEQEFGKQFTPEEIESLKSIKAIVRFLEATEGPEKTAGALG
jgi:acyl carrier protein